MRIGDYSEYVGKRVGHLVITGVRLKQYKTQRYSVFKYRCDCGRVRETLCANILKGHTHGCSSCAKKTHGMSQITGKGYYCWLRIRKDLCEEWQDFVVFSAAMRGKPYRHKVAPIDASRPIGPDNVQFVAPGQAGKKFLFRGKWKNISEIAKMLGITRQAVHARVSGDVIREIKRKGKR